MTIIGSALNYGYVSNVTFSYASAIRLALISIALKSINGYGFVNKIPLKVIVESQYTELSQRSIAKVPLL